VVRGHRAVELVVDTVCVIVIAISLVAILTYSYGRDQGIFAVVGDGVLRGEMPYRDVWDFKPPGIYIIYAMARAVFGASQAGIRVVEVTALLAQVAMLVSLGRRLFDDRRTGLIAAAVATLVHAQLDFWHTAQPESFGGVLVVAALWLVVRARSDRTSWSVIAHWVAAGVALGMAGLLKPPLVGPALPIALFAAHRRRALHADARGWRRVIAWLLPSLVIGGGILIPIAACLAWFAARGALSDLYQTLFVFTPHYTALGWRSHSTTDLVRRALVEAIAGYNRPILVGLIAVVAMRPERTVRPVLYALGASVAILIAGVAMQAKFFPYHYDALWGVLSLLAAYGLRLVWRALPNWPLAAVFVLVVGRLFFSHTIDVVHQSFRARTIERLALLSRGLSDHGALDRLASVADVDAAENRAVATYIREVVPPGEPIFVWGFEPVIYDLADRRPATRYIYNVPQRVAWNDEGRSVLMEDLRRSPPALVLVEHGDRFAFVTGNGLDSGDALNHFPALAVMLGTNYTRVPDVAGFSVFVAKRRPPAR
jgi:hypothetical protein